jgi:addiction module HigA family antidote
VGAHLDEALRGLKAEAGIPVTRAADEMKVARRSLYNVIEGLSPMTPELALRLEAYGLGSAEQWLQLQQAYVLWRARADLAAELAAIPRGWPGSGEGDGAGEADAA